MEPIGLKFKDLKKNKYTGRESGELMIIHKCTKCGESSATRVTGDDDAKAIEALCSEKDREMVRIALYGKVYGKVRP